MLHFSFMSVYCFFYSSAINDRKLKKKKQPKNLLKEEKPFCSFRNYVKECFCNRFHAAVGIGSTAKRDVFCRALFDQVLNPCDQ